MEDVGAILAARLESLDGRVFRGRRHISEANMPCTVLVEGTDRDIAIRPGRLPLIKARADYSVHRYVPCDPDDPNVAGYAARREVMRALYRVGDGDPDTTLGDAIPAGLHYEGCDIAPRDDGARFVLVAVQLSTEVVETLGK